MAEWVVVLAAHKGKDKLKVGGLGLASAPLYPNPRSFGLEIWANCRQECTRMGGLRAIGKDRYCKLRSLDSTYLLLR